MGLILQSSSSIKRLFLLLGTATLLSFACLPSATCSVSYDDRAVIINGQRRILMSGSIHYPRSTPEMWPDLIQKAKDGGIDVIQTYVFWNGHEPSPGKFFFEGRYDLVKFINLVKAAGLYVHLRIGPYVCAEWNFGGFPVWLKFVPGISFRTDNEPFKAAMAKFTKMIVDMMKFEKLFEPQGGPIILSQIENEYGPVEWEIGAPGKAFTQWAAKMAVDLATDVPWIMCKQDEVPDPIINTCNGYYCHDFEPNKKYKPKMFTENWTGWFTGFGGPVPYRPAEDTAYSVAMFVMKGGSFVNYYMYHGGTNFGRTAGGPLLVTSYDYDAPLDEYGLLRQPKWGHLTNLHKAIKTCEPALVSGDPIVTSLGAKLEAYVYKSNTGACAAFLANNDPAAAADVVFQGLKYNLPAWSVSILPDCKTSIYNTAKVEAQISQIGMTSVSSGFTWTKFNDDPLPFEDKESFTAQNLIEQINATWDNTDYLWYSTDVMIDQGEGFLKNGQFPVLNVTSAGHALQVFINGEASGTGYGNVDSPKISFSNKVKLKAGNNKISILSGAVGLPNVGLHFETWNYGVLGPVTLDGLNEGKRDLSLQKWTYRAGLKGEKLEVFTLKGSSAVQWGPAVVKNQPLTWYKTTFDAPVGNDPLALDMSSMGKGLIWINGQGIGRHWPANKAFGNCGGCSYNGPYNEKKCLANCGDSTQKWYHVPRSWLFPKGNLLVVLEEWGGDPAGISLVKRTMMSACAYVPDSSPMINLSCSPGQKFSSIKFASFGNPSGVCGSYKEGSCHAIKSYDIFQKNCIGQQSCSVSVTPVNFGGNPCPNVPKAVAVEALCQ